MDGWDGMEGRMDTLCYRYTTDLKLKDLPKRQPKVGEWQGVGDRESPKNMLVSPKQV